MALILQIKTKDGKISKIPLSGGLIFGRSAEAQIRLEDPKLSGRHAQIDLIAPGHFVLLDLGSTNGIRHGGKKVTQLKLEAGTEFKMGNTEFKVILGTKEKAPIVGAPPAIPDEKPPGPPPPPPKWSDYFIKFIASSLKKIKDQPQKLMPFRQVLRLSFVRGLQAETVWTLGYGPREVGPASVDLVIEEADVPPICFRVESNGTDVIFTTDHPAIVLLNERSIKSDTLKHGDMISIAETRISVGFIE